VTGIIFLVANSRGGRRLIRMSAVKCLVGHSNRTDWGFGVGCERMPLAGFRRTYLPFNWCRRLDNSEIQKRCFVLCGWLPFCKSFFVIDCLSDAVLCSACWRDTHGRWPSLSAMQASPAGQWMVSTNQVPFRISNSKRSGQNTGSLGFRADKFPSLHWSCKLLFLFHCIQAVLTL